MNDPTPREKSWSRVKKDLDLSPTLKSLIREEKDQEALSLYEEKVTLQSADLMFLLRTDKNLKVPTKNDIAVFHEVTFQEVHPISAGNWRKTSVFIFPGARVTCDPHRIPLELDILEAQTKEGLAQAKSQQERIAILAFHHAKFENIHPFLDGNGRCGRILLQAMLEHETGKDIPLCTTIAKNKVAYLQAIELAQNTGDLGPLTRTLCQAAGIEPPKEGPIPSPYRIRPQMRDIPNSIPKEEILAAELERGQNNQYEKRGAQKPQPAKKPMEPELAPA